MPIVEFMLHPAEGVNLGGLRGQWSTYPPFILGPGHWENTQDKTYLGYVLPPEKRGYYIPDTLKEMSKEDCVARALSIHAVKPYTKQVQNPDATPDQIKTGADTLPVEMNELEVREMIEVWYDEYLAENGEA